jgi:transposase-like protein
MNHITETIAPPDTSLAPRWSPRERWARKARRSEAQRSVRSVRSVDVDRAAHRVVMPSVAHDTTRYANNGAEVSHQPTRRRESHMRRVKSAAQAQRFLAVHDVVRNLFTVGRHRLRARHQRLLRSRAFTTWSAIAAA